MFISFLPGVRTSSRRRVGARTALVAFVTALALCGPSTVHASATEGNWYQDSFNGGTADTPVGVVNTGSPGEFRVVRGTDNQLWWTVWHQDSWQRVPGGWTTPVAPRGPHRQRPSLGVHPRSERQQRVLQPAHRCDSGPVVRWTWIPGTSHTNGIPSVTVAAGSLWVFTNYRGVGVRKRTARTRRARVRRSSSERRASLSAERAGPSDFTAPSARRPPRPPGQLITPAEHEAGVFPCTL